MSLSGAIATVFKEEVKGRVFVQHFIATTTPGE